MKRLLILPAVLFLAACQTTDPVVTKTEFQVVKPDPSMYNCPSVRLPNTEKLTDVQVAKLLVTLYKNNRACKNSIDAIQKFLDDSESSLKKD